MLKSRKFRVATTVVLLVTFFFILLSLNTNYIEKFDSFVYGITQTIHSSFTTALFKIITSFSGVGFVLIALLMCLIFIKNKTIKKNIFLIASIVVLLNQIVKIIVARPRPEDIMLVLESGYSFPSAHTMFSFAFYGILLYYLNKSNIRKRYRIILSGVLIGLMILIPITRIYLGVHFASDIVAGLCLSGSILLIFSLLKENK